MTHPGGQNEAKMGLRRIPRGAFGRLLGVSWGVLWGLLGRLGVLRRVSEWPGVSCGVSWGALACSVGSLSGSLGRFGGLMGCPGWLLACAWVLPWENEAKLEANLGKHNTYCVKM